MALYHDASKLGLSLTEVRREGGREEGSFLPFMISFMVLP